MRLGQRLESACRLPHSSRIYGIRAINLSFRAPFSGEMCNRCATRAKTIETSPLDNTAEADSRASGSFSLSQLRSGRVAALRRASRWLRLVEDCPGPLPHARQHVRTRAEAGEALSQVLCNPCTRLGYAAPGVLSRLVDEEADHV